MEALRSFLDPKGRRGGQKKRSHDHENDLCATEYTRTTKCVRARAQTHAHTPRIDKKILTFQVIF